jgi:ADP-heptose:LPS heptosyltransferase
MPRIVLNTRVLPIISLYERDPSIGAVDKGFVLLSHSISARTIRLAITTKRRLRELPYGVYCFAQYFWNVIVKGKELLVIERTQGLGDFICVLWSVRAVRERHPNAWLVLVCPIDCRHLAAYAHMCDVASNAGSPFNRFIRRVCSPALLYRPTNPDERTPPEPQSNRHLGEEAAHFLGVTADPYSVNFVIPQPAQRRMTKRLREINPRNGPLVVIHPGPSWPVREWPMERWAAITARLRATTNAVVVQIGVDFEEYRQVLRRSRILGAIDLVNKFELAEITALLQQTTVFVGIDSGPVHIATTLGVPTIALFGPTDARLRLHPRARSIILNGETACLGCHHALTGPVHWRTGCPNNIDCMKGITADHVYQAIMDALKNHNMQGQREVAFS